MVNAIQSFKDAIPEAKWIFYSNETNEFSGDIDEATGKQYIERISLVLKQTFDALSDKTLSTFVIYTQEYNILLRVFENNTFIWAVIERDKFNQDIVTRLKEFTLKEVAAPTSEEIPPGKSEEVSPEKTEKEAVTVKEELPKISPEVLENFKKIASEYLGDFVTDIFNNVMEDLKISSDNLTKESLVNLCYGLERSAGLLVGPTKARKLADELLEKIKED